MPSPLLASRKIVVAERPSRRRWLWLFAAVALWLGSLYATWELAVATSGPECARMQAQFAAAQVALTRTAEDTQTLRARIAVLERAEQVARGTSRELQSDLQERELEIAALRADLSFYQRLVGGGGEREGLSVHTVALKASNVERVYAYTLTLSQNLKQGRIAAGTAHIVVEGVRGDTLSQLDWSDLSGDTDNSRPTYSFRYFQQLEGSIILPEGFQPHRLKVRLVPEGRGVPIEQDVTWAEALSSGERSNVRQ